MANLVLASGSPRRAEFLQQLGMSFQTYSPDIDESTLKNESVKNYVMRLAQQKAQHVLTIFPNHQILAADTSISIDGKIIGKPQSKQHAFEIWTQLSDRIHTVMTGVCVATQYKSQVCVVETQVKFQRLSLNDMEDYWATGEPLGKAGGYAIQGIAARYIPEIHGSYTNVVGLPLHETVMLLNAISYA